MRGLILFHCATLSAKAHVQTIELRKDWNKPAQPEHGLPTETWRDVIDRRKRYDEIKAKLISARMCATSTN